MFVSICTVHFQLTTVQSQIKIISEQNAFMQTHIYGFVYFYHALRYILNTPQ